MVSGKQFRYLALENGGVDMFALNRKKFRHGFYFPSRNDFVDVVKVSVVFDNGYESSKEEYIE